MKKLVVSFFVIFFILAVTLTAQTYSTYKGAAENKQKYSPLDKSRFKPLSQEEDTLRFTGVFHGQVVGGVKFAWLENELVVFNKITKKFTRIYECGNKGDFFSEKKSDEKYIPLSMLGKLYGPPGLNGKDGENGRNGIDGKDATFSFSWTPITIGAGTGIGVLVGGYGFRTTTTTTITDVTVKSGIRLQTGDGTIIFGPDKTVITKHDIKTKKFNVGAAIGCGIASGLITYMLMEWIF